MTYQVKHTNTSIPAYTVYDNTTNTDTSLKFPGRFVAGYSETIAENFLHLLENFASGSEPSSPQIGQLWYNTELGYLQVYSQPGLWKAASGIEYKATNPGTAVAGQLWVDTSNRQLNIYTGSSWMVVGPTISTRDGLKNGALVEDVMDVSHTLRSILTVYIANIPVAIISKDTFDLMAPIAGYGTKINSGVNLNTPVSTIDKSKFYGGYPQFTGTATAATKLIVGNAAVDSNKFLRTDTINNPEHALNIKHNDGLAIGTDRNLIISYNSTSKAAKLYNSTEGSIELQTSIDHIPTTVLKVTGTTVGINKTGIPSAELDVIGNTKISGKLTVGGGLEVTGTVTKGLITDQADLIDPISPTDQIILYSTGPNLSKTTVANLLASVQQQAAQTNALASRKTLQQTTSSLAANASIKLTLPGGFKGYALYAINVSSTAWVRVYTSHAAADAVAEMGRQEGTPATIDSGVIAEISTTTADQTIRFTPALIGFNTEATPNTDIVVRVKNKGALATTITVKLTILQLEA